MWWLVPQRNEKLMNGALIPLSNVYHQTSDTRRALVGNNINDHSDVVGAPTTLAFSTKDEARNIKVLGFGAAHIKYLKAFNFWWFVLYI